MTTPRTNPHPRSRSRLLRAALLATAALGAASTPALAAQRALIVYTSGDGNSEAASGNVRQVYLGRGFSVDTRTFVPDDLGPYCCLWDVRPQAVLSPGEVARYLGFLGDGHGIMLGGENMGCCGARDNSLRSFIQDAADGGVIGISPSDLGGTFVEEAGGHPVCNSPNSIGQVTYDGFGAGTFTAMGRGTFLTYLPPSGGWVAAVWDEGDLNNARDGRLVSVLDINWLDEVFPATDNRDFVDNIAAFLCPTTTASLTVTITSPSGFDLPCPATLTVRGNVEGTDTDCVQPTTLGTGGETDGAATELVAHPLPHGPGDEPGKSQPALATEAVIPSPRAPDASAPPQALAARITRIEVRVNGGPWGAVSSTNPGLPAAPPVGFEALDLPLPVGNDTIQVRAFDENGRNASDTLSGRVRDLVPPVIDPPSCADETVDLGPGCQLDYSTLPTATDACDPTVTITSVPALPVVFTGPGSVTIVYTARDDAGNTASCTRNVTAVDLSPPVLSCAPPETLECNVRGGRPVTDPGVQAFLAGTTALDNCTANPPITNDAPPFFVSGCAPGHETVVTWTTSDTSGHTATCSAGLRIEDTTPPAITGVPPPLDLECRVPGGVLSSDADVQAWLALFTGDDVCDDDTTLTNDAPALLPTACGAQGPTAVTFQAADECGNADTATQIVTVRDTVPPTLTAPPAITVECTGPSGVPAGDPAIAAWRASAVVSDACSTPTVSDDAPASFPVACGAGTTTVVTFTARDACGNPATATSSVTVVDLTAPTLQVPPALTLECNDPGGIDPDDPQVQAWIALASAADACHDATITHDLPPLLPSGCGAGHVTTVTFHATDACGNVTEATSTITVVDTTDPVLDVPAPLELECDGPGGVAVTDPRIVSWLALATASDVCGSVSLSNDAPSQFASGCGGGHSTTVTFTARDDCGNETLLASTVTVRDTTPPTLTLPSDLTIECNAQGGVAASDPLVTDWLALAVAGDVCGSATLTHDLPPFLPSGCGAGTTTTVTFVATDGCGLTATGTARITVRDTAGPVVSVPPPLELECNGPGGVAGNDPLVLAWLALATSSDVCGTATLTDDAPGFFPSACGPGETTTVTFTARDGCGNETVRTSTVIVRDTTGPDLTVPPPLELECNGPGGVAGNDPQVLAWLALAAATDVCGTVTLTDDAPGFFPSACGPGAVTTVTFTASDDCGNQTVATSTLTVRDTTAPDLTVPPPLELECNGPGGVAGDDPQVLAWLALASATDICDGASITHDAPALFPSACGPGATTTVTFRASDDCGNETVATSTVTVRDTTPPALTPPPPVTLECSAPGGVPASDPRADLWLRSAVATDVCDGATVTHDAPPFFPAACDPGHRTDVRFTAEDNCGNTSQRSSSLTVVDTTPPDLSGCALTPWDLELGLPRAPRAPAAPRSCVSSSAFRIECGMASDVCDSQPVARTAEIVARRHDVVNGACVVVEDTIPAACGEVVELVLVAPPCRDSRPRAPRPPVEVRSDGVRVISGERLELRVRASDVCGNVSSACTVDPATAPDPTNPGSPLLCPPPRPRCRGPVCGD